MKNIIRKFRVMLAILGILSITACLPLGASAPSTPTPFQPTPNKTEEPVPGIAVVQSVDVQLTQNSPLQVNVIARGQLPDSGCTTNTSINQIREGNLFKVTLMTSINPAAMCLATLTPFEQAIALDVANLPPAPYVVDVNGVQQAFELLPRDLTNFKQTLADALNARNYDLLKLMMDESLTLGFYRSEGTVYDAETAIEQLKLNYISASAPIRSDFNKDLSPYSVDPLSVTGMNIDSNHAVFVTGWGLDGKDEAVLYVNYLSDGSLYWHGVLIAMGGFANLSDAPQPTDTSVYATSVQYVMAQKDVTIYNGPATTYAVVGPIFGGQVAHVTGTNSNGSWWRVACPDGSIGSCWVSADASQTQPTTAPPLPPPPPTDTSVYATSVQYVMAQIDVTIYNGPATTYAVVGSIFGGQVAHVTGTNSNGSWWRVMCPNNTVGSCWVLSDPAYTQPTDGLGNNPPSDSSVQPTSVQYVIALQNVNIRSGPGTQYNTLGFIANGQTSKVTGVSADGNWWRVMCPNDTVGSCWVSANSNYTQPTN